MDRSDAPADRDLLEMGGVGRVVTTDHHHQIKRLIHQREHGILALLGCITDGVERQEVVIDRIGAITAQQGAFKQTTDLLGFTFEHRGLVGHTNPRQVSVRVETRRGGPCKALQEGVAITLAKNVIANQLSLLQIQDNQIGPGKRTGGQGLLMLHLAVNHRGEGVLLVALHAVPHFRHPRTGGVNDVATPLVEQLHLLHCCTECRQDHYITALHLREILDTLIHRNEEHIHLSQMGIHRGVVNDFVGDPDALGGVVTAGFISNGNRSLHTPAKAESLGQPDRDAALFQDIAVVTDALDQIAFVGLFQAASHFFRAAEAPTVVTLRVVQGTLERAGIHDEDAARVRTNLWVMQPKKSTRPKAGATTNSRAVLLNGSAHLAEAKSG